MTDACWTGKSLVTISWLYGRLYFYKKTKQVNLCVYSISPDRVTPFCFLWNIFTSIITHCGVILFKLVFKKESILSSLSSVENSSFFFFLRRVLFLGFYFLDFRTWAQHLASCSRRGFTVQLHFCCMIRERTVGLQKDSFSFFFCLAKQSSLWWWWRWTGSAFTGALEMALFCSGIKWKCCVKKKTLFPLFGLFIFSIYHSNTQVWLKSWLWRER